MSRLGFYDRLLASTDDGAQSNEPRAFDCVNQFQERLRADLELLLNARARWNAFPETLSHTRDSVLNYGLPDISTVNLLEAQSQARFCNQLANAIERFEPRVEHVVVTLKDPGNHSNRAVSFVIEARVRQSNGYHELLFDSHLEPDTQRLNIETVL